MNSKTLLLSTALTTISGIALGQSDGGRFDAAVVLVPGLSLERQGTFYEGDYSSGALQSGDILRTANDANGYFYIVTSDGTVIGMSGATTVVIDGSRPGFNVFQVKYGRAQILGNVNNGFSLPSYFNQWMPQPVVVGPDGVNLVSNLPYGIPGYNGASPIYGVPYQVSPYVTIYR